MASLSPADPFPFPTHPRVVMIGWKQKATRVPCLTPKLDRSVKLKALLKRGGGGWWGVGVGGGGAGEQCCWLWTDAAAGRGGGGG